MNSLKTSRKNETPQFAMGDRRDLAVVRRVSGFPGCPGSELGSKEFDGEVEKSIMESARLEARASVKCSGASHAFAARARRIMCNIISNAGPINDDKFHVKRET